ncbi:MAG: hypothetical protein WBA57_00420 [Elainellaceae cyanobacterium]
MSNKASQPPPPNPDSAIKVIGETGGTVVYVFPSGNARVKKGKKLSEIVGEGDSKTDHPSPQSASSQASTAPASKSKSASSQSKSASPKPSFSPSSKPSTAEKQQRGNAFIPSWAHDRGEDHHSDHSKFAPSPRSRSNAPVASPTVTADALGQKIVNAGLISATQLEVAKYDLTTSTMELAEILIARGWVNQEAIAPYL